MARKVYIVLRFTYVSNKYIDKHESKFTRFTRFTGFTRFTS